MRENRVLVLRVNILTVWRAGFTSPHDTLLDISYESYQGNNWENISDNFIAALSFWTIILLSERESLVNTTTQIKFKQQTENVY